MLTYHFICSKDFSFSAAMNAQQCHFDAWIKTSREKLRGMLNGHISMQTINTEKRNLCIVLVHSYISQCK